MTDSAGAEELARIVEVNGTAVTADETNGDGRTVPATDDDPISPTGIFPVDGTITIVVDGYDAALNPSLGGSIRPVAYVNGGASTFLEVSDEGVPSEVYGVGGLFSVSPFPGA